MAYEIEGKLLEVCSCNILCPCWVGEDPDGGTCDSAMAWQIDKGQIEGIDVAGLTFALSVHIPGNVLTPKSWKVAAFVSDTATDDQLGAILKVFTGQLGGAIADFAGLIGEVVSVERVPIIFTVAEGKGRLKIGSAADAQLTPYTGATGALTTLGETAFSTIPGSPVYVAKADHFSRDGAPYGLPSVDLRDNNALQGHFVFAA
jgi:hypothetical protein